MTPETSAAALTARAEYHSDWHVYIDDPALGPLGYCTGTGPWTKSPPMDEAPFTATVEKAGAAWISSLLNSLTTWGAMPVRGWLVAQGCTASNGRMR
ncbi:hypothetical protein [Streptomyces sp. NPDC018000]|uniref:hypothetical protein n=1 Tax=Streptomyces sp. NPDC018000 TaxID=3365028 RepID=UPI00379523D7